MEIVAVILLIPACGLVSLLLLHGLREGDRDARPALRKGIEVIGWTCAGLACGFIAWGLMCVATESWDSALAFLTAFRLVMVGLLAWAGRSAIAVGRYPNDPQPLLSVRTREAQDQDRLLVAACSLILVPVLIPVSIPLIILLFILAINQVFRTVVTRGRENRLLWTLAVGARGRRPLGEDVLQLAQNERGSFRVRLQSLAQTLHHGTPLSQALLTSRRLLPQEVGAAVQVAEETQTVPDSLRELALRHTQQLRQTRLDIALSQTMVYLIGVSSVMVVIMSGVLIFIVPKFKEIFLDFGVTLPPVTMLVIDFADLLASYWYVLLPLSAIPVLVPCVVLNLGVAGLEILPNFVIAVWPRLSSPFLLRSLAAAADAGTGWDGVLLALEETALHSATADRCQRIRRRLEQGDELASTLREERLLNRREARGISHAQTMGHLHWALTAIADRMVSVRRGRVELLSACLPPIALFGMALLVLCFAVGMFSPLVKLIQDLA